MTRGVAVPEGHVVVRAVRPNGQESGYHPLQHAAEADTLGVLARGVIAGRAFTRCGRAVAREWWFLPSVADRADFGTAPTEVTCPKCIAAILRDANTERWE